jgi:hypothetical protein
MGLFKPAWMSENKEKAEAALVKIADPEKLRQAATEAPLCSVRMLATARLTDQALLTSIVHNDEETSVRAAAFYNLTDLHQCAEVLKNDEGWLLYFDTPNRRPLGAIIADQQILFDLATNSKNEYTRKCATENITDQKLLIRIADSSAWKETQSIAIDRVNDQKVIAGFARNSERILEQRILDKLKDQDLLCDLALHAQNDSNRYHALKKVADNRQEVFELLAANDSDSLVRRGAVSRVNGPQSLYELIKKSKDEDFCIDALWQLFKCVKGNTVLPPDIKETFMQITESNRSFGTRIAALKPLARWGLLGSKELERIVGGLMDFAEKHHGDSGVNGWGVYDALTGAQAQALGFKETCFGADKYHGKYAELSYKGKKVRGTKTVDYR